MKKYKLLFAVILLATATFTVQASNAGNANEATATIRLKVPGNDATTHALTFTHSQTGTYTYAASDDVPVDITRRITIAGGFQRIEVTLHAKNDVYFNYGEQISTGFRHTDCQFLMPGFWYRRNLRSPKEAPSFYTSDSWTVREDRLSTPLTAVFDSVHGRALSVIRIDRFEHEALTTHREGEVIVSGKTSLGYTGFENVDGTATLSYGFPYRETPKAYVSKRFLAPMVTAFQQLRRGESITLTWQLAECTAPTFSNCVQRMWEYSYDTYKPQPVNNTYSDSFMKQVLSRYFEQSYVGDKELKFFSGADLVINSCNSVNHAQVGFVGRVLLNAFNALEYGEANGQSSLVEKAHNIFGSYLEHGFAPSGFLREDVWFDGRKNNDVRSIRRQSEGVYAMLYYLDYEKKHGRKHAEWERKIKSLLDLFLKLQNEDGSFPRKFNDDFSLVDKSGGSTPSATLPLVMGYKYFKDKRYLQSAIRTAGYLEKEIISKADYFSSTLDARCEDKEASLYASTAMYYLSLVTKGKQQQHYADLARESAYFALSWYYTWDVPFAQGQMLGDLGLKTRGWGNVSVENNHIDVFIFDFADVLHWLGKRYNEPRFDTFSGVISTSMRQLLPFKGHLCGIAREGYYPEVVQHTNWDYGRNGKGFYNTYFAPGWTVASLWELLTPGRAEHFLK